MVKIEPYTEEFEKIYWRLVKEKVSESTREDIVCSSEKFLPKEFWGGAPPAFKTIILAPFAKLKCARMYIADPQNVQVMRNECYQPAGNALISSYQELVDAYEKVANSQQNKSTMRVRIVKSSGLTVCPYCNRDYINCRGESASGAQLDHFYEKSDYPVFALSLYNLVPVCGNCNRMKSKQNIEFASPFDETINWENDLIFHHEASAGSKTIIIVESSHEDINNNIENMRIEEAYQIHDTEVEKLLEKKRIYCQTQQQEFQDVLYKVNVSEQEIKLAVFGPKITKEAMKTKPLSKMMSDLHKELGIY